MYLKELLKGLKYRTGKENDSIDISSVTDDSRRVVKGGLFIALKGASQDGAEFIDEAVSKGARAVVSGEELSVPRGVARVIVDEPRRALGVIAANFYRRPAEEMKVVGITGTNGKTTITYVMESIINAAGSSSGVIGTINHRIAGKVIQSKNTTPGVMDLQSMFRSMADSGSSYAIMEVSSHSLDQTRIDGIKFDAAVFTNIASDHLDYHKTVENYFEAKKKIFGYMKDGGCAVINNDDSKLSAMRGSLKCKFITYAIRNEADVKAENIILSLDGTQFAVRTPGGTFKVNSKLIGMHNVSNILACIAVSIHLGIPRDAVIRGIASLNCVPGRCDPVDAGQDFKIFVDYAHTEDALSNVLGLLRQMARRKIITVFGCGGDRDTTKRPMMGKAACSLSDHVIITSDNPRYEEPLDIISGIEAGIKGQFDNYEIIPDRREAIAAAVSMAEENDIVLIAGKGHEDYQLIKGRTIHFDDKEIARECLKKKGYAVKVK